MAREFFLLYNKDMIKKLHKNRLTKIAHLHAIFSVAIFLVYIVLSSIYSGEFLLSDIRNKYSAIADSIVTVTAKVLGPPAIPILSGSSVCSNGNLSNTISWPLDEGTETFSIFKDGLPLATGFTSTNFIDNAISANTTYDYQVTAFGQMGPGFADSSPISIATPLECIVNLPDPEVSAVLPMNNKSKLSRPTFEGTSNIPNAIIKLEIHSSQIIFGQTQSNSNGYWNWTCPTDISVGPHTLSVTAQDPNDPMRIATSILTFEIESSSDIKKSTNNNDKSKNPSSADQSKESVAHPSNQALNQDEKIDQKNPENKTTEKNPLDFSIAIEKSEIYQGDNLKTSIKIDFIDVAIPFNQSNVQYQILDSHSQQVSMFNEQKNVFEKMFFEKSIPLSKSMMPGKYKLQIEISNDKFSSSKDIEFQILPKPLISLGAGVFITYPQILSKLGSIALWMILLFLIWLALFSREYWLYLHSLNNITERHLAKIGSFGARKRKEVSR